MTNSEAKLLIDVLNIDTRSKMLKLISYKDFYLALGLERADLNTKSKAKKVLNKLEEVGLSYSLHKTGLKVTGNELLAKQLLFKISTRKEPKNVKIKDVYSFLFSIKGLEIEPHIAKESIINKYGLSVKQADYCYCKWRGNLKSGDFYKFQDRIVKV